MKGAARFGTAPFDMTGLGRRGGRAPSCRLARAKRRVRVNHGVGRVYIALVGGLTPRYQFTVASSPSGNDVLARHPNESKAREVSSLRRGCPSGCEGSNRISPWKSQ